MMEIIVLGFFNIELEPAELEQRYRQDHLGRNKSHALLTVFICVAAVGILVIGELLLVPLRSVESVVFVMRCVVTPLWLGFAFVIWKQTEPAKLDFVMALWAITAIAYMLVLGSLRPEGFYTVPLWIVIGILMVYTAIALPLRVQAMLAAALTLGGCLLASMTNFIGSSPIPRMSELTAYLVANIVGLAVARTVKKSSRVTYTLLDNERKWRIALEEAAAEIKTLQGIVPICAKCKKIRDDEGLWNQVESYIEKHSDAMFSHSLCPQCNEDLYGDQPWFKRMKEKQKEAQADHQSAKTP